MISLKYGALCAMLFSFLLFTNMFTLIAPLEESVVQEGWTHKLAHFQPRCDHDEIYDIRIESAMTICALERDCQYISFYGEIDEEDEERFIGHASVTIHSGYCHEQRESHNRAPVTILINDAYKVQSSNWRVFLPFRQCIRFAYIVANLNVFTMYDNSKFLIEDFS